MPDRRRRVRARSSDERLLRGDRSAHRAAPAPVAARALDSGPASIIQLQRTAGNATVSRSLTNGTPMPGSIRRKPLLQRDDDPAAKKPVATAAPAPAGVEPKEDPLAGWRPIAKLINEQLGDDKIKEHAKTLAGKAVDLLMSQVKDATSEQDFVAKAQVGLIGTMLADIAKKDAETLITSEAGKALQDRLKTITAEQPGVVLAAALAGAAIAYLANPDLPELKKKLDIVKGLSAEGALDLGKIQELTVQKASAALKFTSTHFSAGVSGAYVGEGDKAGYSAGGNMAVGAKEFQFKGGVKLNPDGSVKVDVGQAIQHDKLGMETGATIEKGKMAAIIQIKVGDKDTYVSGKTSVNEDGKVTLDLGIKGLGFEVEGKGSAGGGEKPAGEISVTGKNIFAIKGLDATAKAKIVAGGLSSASGGVSYGMDTKQGGKAFISFTAETVPGSEKDGPPIGAQGVIGVGFSFGR